MLRRSVRPVAHDRARAQIVHHTQDRRTAKGSKRSVKALANIVAGSVLLRRPMKSPPRSLDLKR